LSASSTTRTWQLTGPADPSSLVLGEAVAGRLQNWSEPGRGPVASINRRRRCMGQGKVHHDPGSARPAKVLTDALGAPPGPPPAILEAAFV
jgi:hypothetical protein